MIRAIFAGVLSAVAASGAALAQVPASDADKANALDIYRTVISMRTSEGNGQVPRMAQYLADQLRSAGFSAADIEILPLGETAALVVRYRGAASSGKTPILFLAHMDVVDARREDWELDPFTLNERDGYFVARGTDDNKYGVVNLTQAFMRLKRAGFTPNRDLIIAFSGDEETGMLTTRMLAARDDLIRAEYALNSDAGGGSYDDNGAPLPYAMQSAEKTYATFEVTARNPGGHSSRPRPDNAINQLAAALLRIERFQFPPAANAVTRPALRKEGAQVGGKYGAALIAFADDPSDAAAAEVLRGSDDYRHRIATTCIATMLSAGHAENALPQSASATINCRIFPGVEVETVRATLAKVVNDPSLSWKVLDEPVESPVSEPRQDVMHAIATSVHRRFPGLEIVPEMSSGGTDGMHFRRAGVPTYGAGAVFIKSGDSNAHGLNERLPIAEFYAGLDHWLIVIDELAGDGHIADHER